MAKSNEPDAKDMAFGLQIIVTHLIRTLDEEARKDLFQSLGGWLSRVNKDEKISSDDRTLEKARDYVHYFVQSYTESPDRKEAKEDS